MIVFIQLTTVGANAGPFDLFSDVDAYAFAFASAVPKAILLAGNTYNISGSPTTIKVVSKGVCTNEIDLTISTTSTTTTSTSTSTSTTTTTTTAAPIPDTEFTIVPPTDAGAGVNPRDHYYGTNIVVGSDALVGVELTATETAVSGGAGQLYISTDPNVDYESKVWDAVIGVGGNNPYSLLFAVSQDVFFRVIAGSSPGDSTEMTVVITNTTVGIIGVADTIVMTATTGT